jgi:hypothetical protein
VARDHPWRVMRSVVMCLTVLVVTVSGLDRERASSRRKMLVPLALAQFICSFAGSNMNVMINDISHDLHTDVQGVQVCIISNLGSSIGTAIAGTILVAGLADASRSYGIAMIVLAFIGLLGLGAAVMLPKAQFPPKPARSASG